MQVSNRLVPILITASDGNDVISGLFIAMLCNCVAGRVVLIRIAVGLHFNRFASIPEIPYLQAVLCTEGPHLEYYFIARSQAKGGIIVCMYGGRNTFRVFAVINIDHRKIVCEISIRIRNLHNLAVLTRSLIYPLAFTALCFGPITQQPLVTGNPTRSAPAFRSVKPDCFTAVDQMMRSGHRENFRAV